MAGQFPAVAHLLRSRATFQTASTTVAGRSIRSFAPEAGVLTAPPGLTREKEDAWRRSVLSFRALFPATLDQSFVLEGDGVRVVFAAVGASRASADPSSGTLVYESAYPETDLLHIASPGRTEEMILLRSPRAPVVFEYDIAETQGVSRVFERDGLVYFTDDKENGLVVLRPVVVDADGRRSDTLVRLDLGPETRPGGRRLTLRLDPKGLTYPLLIDPSWTTTGSMGTGRGNPNAVLLPTGKVLIVGGSPTTQAVAELYDPATGIWTTTGSITLGRMAATATLLRSGRVLVAGGFVTGGASTADCRLYDPATGTWSTTGSMMTPRQLHTATLLPNGKVLVSGGWRSSNTPDSTAEVYDPSAGTWTLVPFNMHGPRANHTATLLQSGLVLVAGGLDASGGPRATAEYFDPSTNQWTLTTNTMTAARWVHSATLLPNGNVLVAGDEAFSAADSTAEIYNATTGLWSATAPMTSRRGEHSATLLPNGTVLTAGGFDIVGSAVLKGTETFNPATGLWTVQGNLNAARYGHAAVLLWNGKVLVLGGQNGALTTAELYDPDVGAWSATTGSMSNPRWEHTATLLSNGQVLVAGGNGNGSSLPLAGTELYNPAARTWSPTGNPHVARYLHTGTLLPSGKVLVAGGWDGAVALRGTEIYDPTSGAWSLSGDMLSPREEHTATLLPCGEVLVVGGASSTGILATTERYNPVSGRWRATGSLNAARQRHTATLLPDGRVLVTGGIGPPATALASAEVYDPATETWTSTGSLSTARDSSAATLLPNGTVLVAGGIPYPSLTASSELYDPATGTWATTGSLNFARAFHSLTLLPNGKALAASGGTEIFTTSAELYDPATAKWTVAGNLATVRELHTATLLLDGNVLIAGGNFTTTLSTSETYNVGRGESAAWRPVLSVATDPLVQGAALVGTGSGFQGISEASSGAVLSSATNFPLVQLRRLDNEAISWLPVDPTVGWSGTSFTSSALAGLVPGPTLATVFTNGIPSVSKMISVLGPAATITAQPSSVSVCQGASASFAVGVSGACPGYVWRKAGVPLSDGGHLSGTATATVTVSPVDGTDVGIYDVIVGSACSTTTSTSSPATLSFSFLPPAFGGVASVAPIGGTCGLRLDWAPATTSCSTAATVHYNVYRSTTPAFTPSAFNRIATCVPNAFYNDTSGVSSGTTYYYAVRAEDSSTNFGGACNGGVEETNTTELSGLITGSCTVTSAPSPLQVFTVRATSSGNRLEWVNPSIGPYGSTLIRYRTDMFPTGPSDGTLLSQRFGAPGAHDLVTHSALTNGTNYFYGAFVDNGSGTLSTALDTSGRPFDTSGPVKWAYSTGAASLAPPGIGGGGTYLASNDRLLHGMVRGASGGAWPAGWKPAPFNGPVQHRPPVIGTSAIPGATTVVFAGSQDGYVYAINAQTGAELWQSGVKIGAAVQGAPSGMFTAFGGAFDYVFAGSRSGTADNVFYALNVADGTVAASFNNGGGAAGIGIVSAGASVDYASQRVFFATRASTIGGSNNTLWCLSIGANSLTYVWSQPAGDIDGGPVLQNGRVYVGTNGGDTKAFDAATGNPLWTFSTGDGPVKSFVFADRFSTHLFFSTTGKIWGLSDDGGAASQLWPAVTTVPNPSTVLLDTGPNLLFVGGSDGKLYQLDATANPPTVKSVTLGDGTAAVGAPTLDVGNDVVYVGTDAGIAYAIQLPIP